MAVTNYYSVNGLILGEKSTGGSRVDYLSDALGSVTATVSNTAQVVNTYRYKPYGILLSKTGSGTDPIFLWGGQLGDVQTGLRYAEVAYLWWVYSSRLGVVVGGYFYNDPPIEVPPPGSRIPTPKFPDTKPPPGTNIPPPGTKTPGPVILPPGAGKVIIGIAGDFLIGLAGACAVLLLLPAPTGDESDPIPKDISCRDFVYRKNRQDVRNKCHGVKFSCDPVNAPGLTCDQMRDRRNAARECWKARRKMTVQCYQPPRGKPDAGHDQQEREAKVARDKCNDRLDKECGGRSR